MVFAVLEIGDGEGGLAGVFPCGLFDIVQFLADPLIGLDFLFQGFCCRRIFVEVIRDRIPYLRHQGGTQIRIPEFVLGLGLKDRFLDLDCDGRNDPVPDVRSVE